MTHEPRADLWTLDPAVDYLNHGSFGACPKAILDKQSELRARLEKEPMDFLVRALPGLLAEARAALGAFVALGMRKTFVKKMWNRNPETRIL